MSFKRKGFIPQALASGVQRRLANTPAVSGTRRRRLRLTLLAGAVIGLTILAGAVALPIFSLPDYIDITVASDTGRGDWLGSSVAASGATVAVGAFRESGQAERGGTVYVGERDADGHFNEQAKLLVPDAVAGSQSGFSVTLDGDWLATGAPGILGKPGGNASRGRVDVFHRAAGTWTHQLTLRRPDATDNDRFGFSVAMAGAVLVVGARGVDDSAGAVYVYHLDNPLLEPLELRAPEPAVGDRFGEAVAFDGATLLVGAPGRDDVGNDAGAVYVFKRTDDAGFLADVQLLPPIAEIEGRFGVGVDVDGEHAIVGASHWDAGGPAGRVWFVNRSEAGRWSEPYPASAEVGNASILTPAPAVLSASEDMEGFRVAIDGEMAVASAHLADAQGIDSGALVVFVRTSDGWRRDSRITPLKGDADDVFGIALALDDGLLVAGAEKADVTGRLSGGFYLIDPRVSR